jgi:hypothetical protein
MENHDGKASQISLVRTLLSPLSEVFAAARGAVGHSDLPPHHQAALEISRKNCSIVGCVRASTDVSNKSPCASGLGAFFSTSSPSQLLIPDG